MREPRWGLRCASEADFLLKRNIDINNPMQYITTILLVLMTATFITCGVLLWRRRTETGDYSRTIQALFSWVSAFFTFTFIFRTWAGTAPADATLFEPEHTFVPLLCQMTFFFYPLEVIRPTMSRAKSYILLFVPLLLLVTKKSSLWLLWIRWMIRLSRRKGGPEPSSAWLVVRLQESISSTPLVIRW